MYIRMLVCLFVVCLLSFVICMWAELNSGVSLNLALALRNSEFEFLQPSLEEKPLISQLLYKISKIWLVIFWH